MHQFLVISTVLSTILFGSFAMFVMLDINASTTNKKTIYKILLYILVILSVKAAVVFFFGVKIQTRYYMLLVHLPIFLAFWYPLKINPIKILFTLYTAVFFIFPATFSFSIIVRFVGMEKIYIPIVLIFIFLICILFLIQKYVKKDFNYLIKHYDNHSFVKLFLLPLIYNFSAFWVGQYNYSLLQSNGILIFHSLLFLVTFIAYILIFDIAKTSRNHQTMKKNQEILSLQLEHANKQMAFFQSMQEQTIIYRHDMRHHLSMISVYANNNDIPKIKEYLSACQVNIDGITPIKYCENETINLIVSFFSEIAAGSDINLCTDIDLPEGISISNTELCSLFANILENAICAVENITDESLRKVYIRSKINKNKLLISTENAYVGAIEMEGELPKSKDEGSGHGFGLKSIAAIVERHNGLYSIDAQGGIFVLQLMIPLKLNM